MEKIDSFPPSEQAKSAISTEKKIGRVLICGLIGSLALGGGSLAATIGFGMAVGVCGLGLFALGPVGWIIGAVALVGFVAGALVATQTFSALPKNEKIQESKENISAVNHESQTIFAPTQQNQNVSNENHTNPSSSELVLS